MLGAQLQSRDSPWLRSKSIWAPGAGSAENIQEGKDERAEITTAGRTEHMPTIIPWRRQSLLPSNIRNTPNQDPQRPSAHAKHQADRLQGGMISSKASIQGEIFHSSQLQIPFHHQDGGIASASDTRLAGKRLPQYSSDPSNVSQSLSSHMHRLDISEQAQSPNTCFSNYIPIDRDQNLNLRNDAVLRRYQYAGRDDRPYLKYSANSSAPVRVAQPPPPPVSPLTVSGHDASSGRTSSHIVGQQHRSGTPQSSQPSAGSVVFDRLSTNGYSSRSSVSHQSGGHHDFGRSYEYTRAVPSINLDCYADSSFYGHDDGFQSFHETNHFETPWEVEGTPSVVERSDSCLQNPFRTQHSTIQPSYNKHTDHEYRQNSSRHLAIDPTRTDHSHTLGQAFFMPSYLGNTMAQQPCPPGAQFEVLNGTWQWNPHTQDFRRMLAPNIYGPEQTFELDATHGVRSKMLHDFKQTPQEFAGDQAGSKFIQTRLETANSEEKARIFQEILPNSWQLMNDVFGNYVMQKYFKFGDQYQKVTLVRQMEGKVLSLAKHTYGCRVLQKALKYSLLQQQISLISELSNHTLVLIKDQNGNHVVQKIIKHVIWTHIPTVINTCINKLQELSIDVYGCRIVQRLLDHYKGPMRAGILEQLHRASRELITDQYGNYVMQWIIRKGGPEDRQKVMSMILGYLVGFAKQKFASNVVEKCIEYGTADQKREIMLELCSVESLAVASGQADSPSQMQALRTTSLEFLIRDSYGNYVIRKYKEIDLNAQTVTLVEACSSSNAEKLLDSFDNVNDYTTFVSQLEPAISRIKRMAPCKQADNVYKKMLRLEWPYDNGSGRNHHEPRLKKVIEEHDRSHRMFLANMDYRDEHQRVSTSSSSDSSEEESKSKEASLGLRQSYL